MGLRDRRWVWLLQEIWDSVSENVFDYLKFEICLEPQPIVSHERIEAPVHNLVLPLGTACGESEAR